MLYTQLKVFKKVAERLSFSNAAEELFMTQSAVSQHIQNLESYYGVKLFERLHRRVELTLAGKVLYPYAAEAEHILLGAQKKLQQLTEAVCGKLNIGASLTIGEFYLPEKLVEFRKKYPEVEIAMSVQNSQIIINDVKEAKLQVGFIEGYISELSMLTSEEIADDELIIIAPPDLNIDEKVSVASILAYRWVVRESLSGTRQVFEYYLTEWGYDAGDINVVMELSSTIAIKQAVRAGLGIAVVSKLAVKDEIRTGQLKAIYLTEGQLLRTFKMIYQKSVFQTNAAEMFMNFVKQYRADRA